MAPTSCWRSDSFRLKLQPCGTIALNFLVEKGQRKPQLTLPNAGCIEPGISSNK